MRVSDKGLVEIAEHEGIVPAPYRDSVGVWTFGVGHTAAAGGLDPREMNASMPTGTELEFAVNRALRLFRDDVVKYEVRVLTALRGTPVKQHQFDALVSWDFNTGGASWRSKSGQQAQLLQQIHRGDFSGDGFMGWLKPPELRKRRLAEQRLFRTGDYDHNGTDVPIWGTDGKGRLRGIVGRMDGRELLSRMDRPQNVNGAAVPSFWRWLLELLGVKR